MDTVGALGRPNTSDDQKSRGGRNEEKEKKAKSPGRTREAERQECRDLVHRDRNRRKWRHEHRMKARRTWTTC